MLLRQTSTKCSMVKQSFLLSNACSDARYQVDRSASEADIKKAYKKLSRKYHPDKNKDEAAQDRFVEVAYGGSLEVAKRSCGLDIMPVAYEVLSDPTVRLSYSSIDFNTATFPIRNAKYTIDMERSAFKPHAAPHEADNSLDYRKGSKLKKVGNSMPTLSTSSRVSLAAVVSIADCVGTCTHVDGPRPQITPKTRSARVRPL